MNENKDEGVRIETKEGGTAATMKPSRQGVNANVTPGVEVTTKEGGGNKPTTD